MFERSSYDSNIADKANTILTKRLRDLITDTSKLREHLGCSAQAINQFKQGTAFPKTENLIKIADFYDVSVDYLLGITDTKSRNTTIQAICEYTGLSETAVIKLHLWKDVNDRHCGWGQIISSIINSGYSEELFRNISEVKGFSKIEGRAFNNNDVQLTNDAIEMQMARQWRVSRIFSNIVDEMSFEERERESEH